MVVVMNKYFVSKKGYVYEYLGTWNKYYAIRGKCKEGFSCYSIFIEDIIAWSDYREILEVLYGKNDEV